MWRPRLRPSGPSPRAYRHRARRPHPRPSVTPNPASTQKPPTVMNCTGTASSTRSQVSGTGPFGTTIATGSKDVALTFDDGPDPVNSPKILDLLKQCGVKATFCINGIKVASAPNVI